MEAELLKVIEIKEFEKFLSPEAQAIYNNKLDVETLEKDEHGTCKQVVSLQVRYETKTGEVEERMLQRLADIFNICAKENKISSGIICQCSKIDLADYDKRLNRYVNKDRKAAVVDEATLVDLMNIAKVEEISSEEDIMKRFILCVWVYTDLNKFEINEFLNSEKIFALTNFKTTIIN